MIDWISNPHPPSVETGAMVPEYLRPAAIGEARDFLSGCPAYEVTPLHSMDALAREIDVDRLWIKDESQRFGLNAFKVLGGAYAIGQLLGELTGAQEWETLTRMHPDQRHRWGPLVSATDGNHGFGVAWTAAQMGLESIIFMPHGASPARVRRIEALGARVIVTEHNYDGAVRQADTYARREGGHLVQDTAWPGYEQVPQWIMQGYGVIIDEVWEQLQAMGESPPTHLLLQVGVGSFAASMIGAVAARTPVMPATILIEPKEAAPLFHSVRTNAKQPVGISGDLNTLMAGLSCGEINPLAWDLLRTYGNYFVTCSDAVTVEGMRRLAHPLESDPIVVAGESGAVGVGLLIQMQKDPDLETSGRAWGLSSTARVLCINTEGDTDPESYQQLIADS